jgi:hypothetical protein
MCSVEPLAPGNTPWTTTNVSSADASSLGQWINPSPSKDVVKMMEMLESKPAFDGLDLCQDDLILVQSSGSTSSGRDIENDADQLLRGMAIYWCRRVGTLPMPEDSLNTPGEISG